MIAVCFAKLVYGTENTQFDVQNSSGVY